jgi:hypothetical protein
VEHVYVNLESLADTNSRQVAGGDGGSYRGAVHAMVTGELSW